MLIDNKIKKISPEKEINNEFLKKKINDLIDNNNLDIVEILKLIPVENNEKQKDIRFIYKNLFFNGKELNEKKINLEQSFWDKANDIALDKILTYLKEISYLSDIDENENNALKILEILYKYKPPQINEELKIVPNQNGKLCSFNELNNEKKFNKNFKKMLKQFFDYNLSDFLIHKKTKLKTSKILEINEDIIKRIKNSFNNKITDRKNIEKAKELIKFYPKNEKEDEDNLVKQFIKCYKALSGEKIDEEEINTINTSLWDEAIIILLIQLLIIIDRDKNINATSKRIGIIEENVIINLNIFYKIFFNYLGDSHNYDNYNFVPNVKGNYMKLNDIYCNTDIDEKIRKTLSSLNKENNFDSILIYPNIKLSRKHQEKTLEDIANKIDEEIKKKYNKIDLMIENDKINIKYEDDFENIKKACKMLFDWIYEHKEKKNLFEFVSKNITEFGVKIFLENVIKNKLDNLIF